VDTSLTWLGRLIAAPSEGDWKQLLDVYGPLLTGWLARAGVPATDRDDLIQETLLVVVRQIGEFEHRGVGAFRAWLRAILANHIRKFFRTRRDAPAVDLEAIADPHSVLGRQWDREHDQHLTERALRLIEHDFAPTTWQAFRLQVNEGKSPAEVASQLGMSLNAVILAKSRILKRLRQELQGLLE
jgi:RNA polymerase sigma-70 factor (ECF subfamily)